MTRSLIGTPGGVRMVQPTANIYTILTLVATLFTLVGSIVVGWQLYSTYDVVPLMEAVKVVKGG